MVEDDASRLRTALTRILRKLGLVGRTAPLDADLLRIADAYAGRSALFGGRTVAATDDGRPFQFGECLAPADPKVDKDIPF